MSNHMVSVVLYGLTYLSVFKILFRSVLSTVYFCFRNYHITDVVFSFVLVSNEKNMKVGIVEPLADGFQPFSSRIPPGLCHPPARVSASCCPATSRLRVQGRNYGSSPWAQEARRQGGRGEKREPLPSRLSAAAALHHWKGRPAHHWANTDRIGRPPVWVNSELGTVMGFLSHFSRRVGFLSHFSRPFSSARSATGATLSLTK